ncbi:uroporphyrinogen-III synthase [Neobacillus notoginsengisoli]|uniref:Uroporphyrinogen-III synthase n=1 Tax=Neobacillus notoginsengisoli TaxID=1578198 RepID=A0A417YU35_9BACI|nr:uroporphyrinogen-III synthase [Neobacillus notoginsengisoli]RHW40658.1 uroporphyrinogen-III synthase [Neobacillus notoginsengisoli]
MNRRLPLSDKKVLVPRGASQAKSFSRLIEKHGGIPVEIPLISFKPVALNDSLFEVIEKLETYDWIVFTSNVTVETFLSFFPEGLPVKLPRIAAIGDRTGHFLKEKGYEAEFIPSKYVAEVFAEEFIAYINKGSRVLIPKGNLAREHISKELKEHGSFVDEIIVYETCMPEESKKKLLGMLEKRELDVLMFTSPSTIGHFVETAGEERLKELADRCVVACIGPVTLKKLQSLGIPVHACPDQYTVEHMVNSTIEYLESIDKKDKL